MYAPPLRIHYESILSSILGVNRKFKSSQLLQAYATFSAMIEYDISALESYRNICKEYVDYGRALLRITDEQCKSLRYEEIAKYVDLPLQDFMTYGTPDVICDPAALMMHYHDYNRIQKLDQLQLIHHIIAIKLNSYLKIPLNQRLESTRDPLLQGEDNDYYLKHTWNNKQNVVGSIFLETRNSNELTEFNTIIYGHNMRDGSMFASIKQYREQLFWEQHPYVYICTQEDVFRYEVIAAYEADVDSSTYGLSFNQEETKVKFLADTADRNNIQTSIEPALTDRILTLSTCTGSGYSSRWVVQARLKMVFTT